MASPNSTDRNDLHGERNHELLSLLLRAGSSSSNINVQLGGWPAYAMTAAALLVAMGLGLYVADVKGDLAEQRGENAALKASIDQLRHEIQAVSDLAETQQVYTMKHNERITKLEARP